MIEDRGSLGADILTKVVQDYQKRTFAEDVVTLEQLGEQLSPLLQLMQTDLERGISEDTQSLEERRNKFGSNQKQKRELPGLCALFFEALKDFTLVILMVAAVLSIGLQTGTAEPHERSIAWIEGFAILVAVFVCASVTAVNDYQKQRQFQELNSVADSKKMVSVRRSGKPLSLHEDDLLVGDVVDIVEGMQLPADGILFDASQITTDESAMTGQTQPMLKSTLRVCSRKLKEAEAEGQNDKNHIPSPVLMSGTQVMTGEGKMIVCVVGQYSCLGKLRKLLEKDEEEQTPLQQKLEAVSQDIGKFGLISAIFIVIVLLIRLGIERGTASAPQDRWNTSRDLVKMLNFVILGITVVVVAIPEGLPLSVTLSLAFSVKKMLKDSNLVRRMEACQTMGGANNICSDKTGTLTLNQMLVAQIWTGSLKNIQVNEEKLNAPDYFPNEEFYELFKIASLVNSSAELDPPKGSSTEMAFLKMFRKMGVNYADERQQVKVEMKIPFSSSRKRMSVIANHRGQLHLFTKGASEMILQGCSDWLNSDKGSVEILDQTKLREIIDEMASNSLRTLCLAYKKLSGHDDLETKDSRGVYNVEKNNLVLLAVVGVKDMPRPEVPDAIRQCHQAGITVRMVTGDNIITAKAIARDIGLTARHPNFKAMQGPEFSALVGGVVCEKCRTEKCDCPINADEAEKAGKDIRKDTILNGEEFDKIKDDLLILARSRPEDKYCLVTALKERGNVVAVTGDGTNDAPALKKADVGFAMGISGTEVARDAAAIILIDDNFSSIVKAVLWGRNIYDSIRKFIQFQLTVNVVAVVITLVGAAVLQREVLKPIQMLWVNLIMDTLASLALATEEPHPDLLKRQPHSRDDYIISKTMLKHIIGQSIYQITILLILVFVGEQFIPEFSDTNDTIEPYLSHPEYKWSQGVVGGTISSGRFFHINGSADYDTAFDATHNYSRHFTFIFNTFVMLQVFNFLNARKLQEEFNVFSGITGNCFFPVIVIAIMVLQVILVTFTGYAFGVYDRGLHIIQWLICIAFGSGSLLVSVLLKCLPLGRPHSEEQGRVMPIRDEGIRLQTSNYSFENVNLPSKLMDSPVKLRMKASSSQMVDGKQSASLQEQMGDEVLYFRE